MLQALAALFTGVKEPDLGRPIQLVRLTLCGSTIRAILNRKKVKATTLAKVVAGMREK